MAFFTLNRPKTSALLPAHPNPNHYSNHRNNFVILFQSLGLQSSKRNQNDALRVSAQRNEIALEKSTNSTPASKKREESPNTPETTIPDAATITAFMNQVAGLVQLVDSRDIVELELKQHNFEVLIRKKRCSTSTTSWPNRYDAISPTPGNVSIITTSTRACTCFFKTSSFCICTSITLTYPCETKVLSPSTEMPHGWNILPVSRSRCSTICEGWRQGAERPGYMHY